MLGNVGKLKTDVLSVCPSSERIEKSWVVLGLYAERWSLSIGGNLATYMCNHY